MNPQFAAKFEQTLREATNTFLNVTLHPEHIVRVGESPEVAKTVLLTMRSFQEGAYWAIGRVCQEMEKAGLLDETAAPEELLSFICETLDERDLVRDLSQVSPSAKAH